MFLAFCRSLLRLFRRLRAASTKPAPRRRTFLALEGLETRWVPSVIGGTVYNDVNRDGLYQSGEPVIANNEIDLHDATGALIATTQTDANGQYQFTVNETINTSPQTREVDVTFDPAPTNSTRTANLAQFDPTLGTLTSVQVINEATLTSDIKAESLDAAPSEVTGTVSGTVEVDLPGESPLSVSPSQSEQFSAGAFDGTVDFAGTSGHDFGPKSAQDSQSMTLTGADQLAPFIGTGNVTVTEKATATSSATGPGNVMSQINTTSSGRVRVIYTYTPSNALQPGNYTLVQPNEPPGYLDYKESNSNGVLPGSIGTDTIPVTLGTTDQLNNNFGEILPASLSGFDYADQNDNCTKDAGEPGLGGVLVQLQGTNDLGQSINTTTTTGSDGSYTFGNLRPGTYQLAKLTEPAGYMAGCDSIGTQGGQTDQTTNTFSGLNLAPGQNGQNNNFAELLPGQLSGFVYVDLNNNGVMEPGEPGIPGQIITLTGTTLDGRTISETTPTLGDGSYSFPNLAPGNYTITQIQPPGYLEGINSVGSLGGTQSESGPVDNFFVSLGMGQTGLNYNFAEVLPPQTLQSAPPVTAPETATPPTLSTVPVQSPAALTPNDIFFAFSKRAFIGDNWMAPTVA